MQFTINGIEHEIGEAPCGKWCWSTATDEGKLCDTALDAQQDAIDSVRCAEAEAIEQAEYAEQCRAYGSHEAQVRAYFNSTRL